MEPFDSKTAIVTGAASGIGRALAEELGQRGAYVVVADIDTDGARRVANAIRQRKGQAEAATLDVRDPEQVRALVERVARIRARLDYIFNNAGIAIVAEALEMNLDDWSRIIDVNLRGVVHGIHAAYPIMARQGAGHIVNTASIAGLMPSVALSAYAATKHAVVGLSTSLRAEAERYGVKVSVICPGLVDTPIKDNAQVRGFDRNIIDKQLKVTAYPPHACARDALQGVARNEGVIVVTPHGKVLTSLHRYAPGLFGRLMRREARKGLERASATD